MMTWNPALMFPMSLNPFPVSVVVAINPDLPARWVGAYIDGAKGRQESQTQTYHQQFHRHYLLFVFRLNWSGPFPHTLLYIGKAEILNDRNEEVKRFVYTLPGLFSSNALIFPLIFACCDLATFKNLPWTNKLRKLRGIPSYSHK